MPKDEDYFEGNWLTEPDAFIRVQAGRASGRIFFFARLPEILPRLVTLSFRVGQRRRGQTR